MQSDRRIGKVVSVNSYSATIELDKEAQSFVKNSFEETHKIGIINSYVIIPIGADKIVGIVTKVNMFEDSELNYKSSSTVVLPKSKRTMTVTMIGSIVAKTNSGSKMEESKFEYGIIGYPSLDNEVWSITEDELNIIFKIRKESDDKNRKFIKIGTSTVFPDYPVVIDMDKFFGKHAAILGNTGSGKSCTVTAIIRSVLEDKPEMKNTHFIIFDTNNEYESAFQASNVEGDKRDYFNQIVVRSDWFKLPHWFMNTQDFDALFTPSEQVQRPILHNAITKVKENYSEDIKRFNFLDLIKNCITRIKILLEEGRGAIGTSIHEDAEGLTEAEFDAVELITAVQEINKDFDPQRYFDAFKIIFDNTPPKEKGFPQRLTSSKEPIVRSELFKIESYLEEDQKKIRPVIEKKRNLSVDSPTPFKMIDLINMIEEEIKEQSIHDTRVRSNMGTLLMRVERMLKDARYDFLFKNDDFSNSLASFLRLIFGEDPSKNFKDNSIPWQNQYEEQIEKNNISKSKHNVTIIDFSAIASEVLENITSIVGRLIFEFTQRINPRGSFPVVLILEEAHHYIPENAISERQTRARHVFEKIAKEGRKFGLSLLIASQRPSELSKTIMAQCNSFIVHRIQNPEDQQYFKSVISSVSHDLLNQLPALPQQSAIVMGDCVTAPIQVTIRDVDPIPDSNDPKFSRIWSDPNFKAPDFEEICKKWENGE